MPMLKHEMRKGVRCYVHGHSIQEDNKSTIIDSKGTILKNPVFSTVLVELDNPPKGIPKEFNVPVECVYWTNQNRNK